jgi:hypothetical protein
MWMIQTRALLGSEAEHIEHLVNEGLLTPHSAEDYLDTIRQDIRVLDREKHTLRFHNPITHPPIFPSFSLQSTELLELPARLTPPGELEESKT